MAGLRLTKRANSKYWQSDGTMKINGISVRVREPLGTEDKDEAYLNLKTLEFELLTGKKVIGKKKSSGDILIEELIIKFKQDVTTGSGRTTEQLLTNFHDRIGKLSTREFTQADASQYIYEYHTSQGHSVNNIRRVMTQLQSLLNYGFEQGFRAEKIKIKKPPEEIKDIEVFTREEIEKIFKHLDAHTKRLCSFILNTGARPIEAMTLKKKDLDLPRKEVTLTSIKGKNRKARKRVIPLNAKAYAAAHGNQLASADHNGELVFTYLAHGLHRPFHTEAGKSVFNHRWNRACIAAKVVGKPPYTLRHTFGTRLGNNNTPFATVQSLMGHTDPKTTMRYVHPTYQDHVNAVTSIV